MDPLTLTALITPIATKLGDKAFGIVVDELRGQLRRAIGADPTALQKCFAAGFQAALNEMRPPNRERLARYEGVLLHWLDLPEVAEELAKLVDVGAVIDDPTRVIDLAKLNALFMQAYPVNENPDAYAGLNFSTALRAFVRAYTAAVEKQADKFPWLQFKLLKEMISRLEVRPSPNTVRELYLNWLAGECDFLPLSVFSEQESAPETETKATLHQVYVPLDVFPQPPTETRRSQSQLHTYTPEELSEIRQEQRVPALRALAENKRMVLLGDPGSGKTTLTNFLAYCLAKDELEPDANWLAKLEGWNLGRLVPARLNLREFVKSIPAQTTKGNAGLLWKFIESEIHNRGLTEFYADLRAELLERGGVLILDGLDEVTDANGLRDRVRECIVEFAGNVPKCRIIVTCRTYAYPASPLKDFAAHPLLPFSPKQIEQFIDQWYGAIRDKEHLTVDEAKNRAAMLKSAVNAQINPHIADLARRPLLLTLMAMVYASAGKLPDDRADLYERCVQLLLDRWQERKKIYDEQGREETELGLAEKIGIQPDALRDALNRVAFNAHTRQGEKSNREFRTADIPTDELRKALALDSEKDFQAVLRYIHHRAGLIYWRGGDVYAFPHRSFQEYLTACHISSLGDPQIEICKRVRQDPEWWREVYLLQVGRLRKYLGTAIGFVNILCPADLQSAAPPNLTDWRSAILAGQALDELHLVNAIDAKRQQGDDVRPFEIPLDRVRNWLVALTKTPVLTPRERAQGGLVLGALGDPRDFYELCRVPAGEFILGEEKEAHMVSTPEFWIAKYPVTCAQYRQFIDADGYKKPEYWQSKAAKDWLAQSKQTTPKYWDDPRWNQPNLPVVGVTWFEASAFCEWLNERIAAERGELRIDNDAQNAIRNSKFLIRLPTEAEWEKAATWDAAKKQKRVYPWEGEFDPAKANTREGENPVGGTSSVGIYPNGASPCGALDMAGNVWEWCHTIYQDYPYKLDAKHESSEARGRRVLRGGAWFYYASDARGAYRGDGSPDAWNGHLGFRFVVSSSLNFWFLVF